MNRWYLNERLKELGYDAKSLAPLCGVSEGYMKQILKGYQPSKPTLLLISHALKCTVGDLVDEPATSGRRKAAAGS